MSTAISPSIETPDARKVVPEGHGTTVGAVTGGGDPHIRFFLRLNRYWFIEMLSLVMFPTFRLAATVSTVPFSEERKRKRQLSGL